MQWYVYLITVPAVLFLGQVAVELMGRPVQTILRLRREVLERLLAFRDMKLPRPRETAVSSQQIREHNWAAQNVRQAQRTFFDLGGQLVAFNETEPTICALITFCGIDIVLAGNELINLAHVYAAAKSDSGKVRRAIEEAHHAANCALAVSHRRSGNDTLTNIRLEPMRLPSTPSRRRQRSLGRRARPLVARQHTLGPRRGRRQDTVVLRPTLAGLRGERPD
jgi:hypothetical protein